LQPGAERLAVNDVTSTKTEEQIMKNVWNPLGTVAGYLGIAICVVAVAGRFYGAPAFLGFAASSVLQMGIASMVLGCWAKLEAK
jgi:hypothetical protein